MDKAGTRTEAAGELRLREQLGRGGMGEVWLAEQCALGREVAVKVPHPGGSRAAALIAEARLAGALEHPHIVPVHDLSVWADGRPVLVMKRVDGATLEALSRDTEHPAWVSLLARHGDRERVVLECLLRVADALSFAHSRGVLHRDIKPENIMLGAFGEAYLMDWGCAIPLGRKASVAGTPAFMAPEMLASASQPLDVRADVYLLGATLHAALTGRPRHEASTLAELLETVRRSAPVAYDARVPADLAALCNRATASEPAGRYMSVEELRSALSRALRLRTSLSVVERIMTRANLAAGDGSAPEGLQRLREAHHALAPLAQEWPEEPAVQSPLRQVLEALVCGALALGRLEEAEAVFVKLREPPEVLVEAMRRSRASAADSRRHAEVGAVELRERDVRPSLKGALAMLVFMACNAFSQVAFLSSGGELTMLDVFRSDIFATVLLLVGAVAYRRTLLANRRGKSTTAAIFLLVLGMTTSDGLSALVGQTPQAAAPFSLFASAFGFAALTTLLDLRARSRWVAGGCATLLLLQAVCAAQVPASAVTLLSMSVLETVVAAGLIVMDMVREGAPPEEAG